MKRVKELATHIKNGERDSANCLLDNIYKENECRAYCVALEKILLTQVAQELNDTVRGFYIDTEKLNTALFSDNPPTRKTVFDSFRDILAESKKEDMEIAFVKAVSYINENLTDSQLCVSSVAEYTGKNERELSELFRKKEGITAGEYINKKRVEKSLYYLQNDETIASASKKSGFSSSETYIRVFKKHMSMTCIEYINNLRLEKSVEQFEQGNTSILDVSLSVGFHNLSYFSKTYKEIIGNLPTNDLKSSQQLE